MITEERLVAFINSFDKGNPAFLEEIEAYARAEGVPVVRRQTQGLLKFLMAFARPERILEVGTAIGFSALLMCEYAPAGCRIVTVERREDWLEKARENIAGAGRQEQITPILGDAAQVLPKLTESFDLIFMDAAKGQYLRFLPQVLKLLSPGGLLISDNVLQDGDVLESRFAVPRRNRTIHARMREYLYELKNHPELETVILPVGDGVTLSVKRSPAGDAQGGAAEEERG